LGLVKSRSEAKRLIDQGAIEIIHQNGRKTIMFDDRPLIRVGDIIKVGKRRFVRIVDADKRS
jgi:tyrosyl-tRNA synthetase